MPTPLPSMLKRIAAGERLAARECIAIHGGLVWYLARCLSPTRSDAEDAAQQIFMSIWRGAASFDPARSSETAFIATLAKRCLLERLRKAGADVPLQVSENS